MIIIANRKFKKFWFVLLNMYINSYVIKTLGGDYADIKRTGAEYS